MDLYGWVGVGLGGNCDCRCGIFMLLCWGRVVFAGLISLTSSRYSSELFVIQFKCTTQRREDCTQTHTHTHTPGTRTPKHPRN